MKKFVLAIAIALSSSVALAGEVGARNPQLLDSEPSFLELAIADTGASISWAVLPFNNKANAHQLAALKTQVDFMNQSMNTALEAVIDEKLANRLQY